MTTLQTTQREMKVQVADPAQRLADHYNEPDWLREFRQEAWAAYLEMPLPDQVSHLWRYTDPEQFDLGGREVVPAGYVAGAAVEQAKEHFKHENHAVELISKNGVIVEQSMSPKLKDQGVLVMDLHQAAREHPDKVKPHLGRIVGRAHGKFEALNEALWQGGVFVYVPRGVVIPEPIHLNLIGDNDAPFLAPRLLAVIDESAQATLVDEYTSQADAELTANGVVEIVLRQSSHLQYVAVQRWGEKVKAVITQRAEVHRDAQFLTVWAGLGGSVVKADLGSNLVGRGANAKLLGMSFGRQGQHFDHHTVHDHFSGNTYSDLDFKVVLNDQARSAYTGLIRIEEEARSCEAYQENRNLLLNEKTRADTIPELEILNDEVSCSHGATVGPVDEEMLFYLAARGISRKEAIRMVVSGFVEPTIQGMPEDLRDRVRQYVLDRVQSI